MIKLSKLQLNDKNPRSISVDNKQKLKDSLNGFMEMLEARPIVVDEAWKVLAGNQKVLCLQELGIKELPNKYVKQVKGWTQSQKKEFIVRDNTHFGEWLDEMFEDEYWKDEPFEDWLDSETDKQVHAEAKEDDYEIPETIKTDIVTGDLFEFVKGDLRHRLLCGDSTNVDDVERLMDGVKADLVVTDPPYNTGMSENKDNAKARLSHMFNDNFSDQEWRDFITAFCSNYNIFSKGECAIYVFIDWRRLSDIKEGLERIADVKNVIVWDKKVHGLGSDYKSTYELCVVGKKGKPEINNRHGLDYQDIWRVQRQIGRNKDHATAKPIELISKPIIHASKKDDIVLDLFGGSGTTMASAHQLERNCYMQEMIEKYCQVIIDRMLKLDPEIKLYRNGKDVTKKYRKKIEEYAEA